MPLSVPIYFEPVAMAPGQMAEADSLQCARAAPNSDGGCHSAMQGESVGRARGEPVGGRGQYDVEARSCAGQPL